MRFAQNGETSWSGPAALQSSFCGQSSIVSRVLEETGTNPFVADVHVSVLRAGAEFGAYQLASLLDDGSFDQ